jgi:hypothetical protein
MLSAPENPQMYHGHSGRAPVSRAPAACTELNLTVWDHPQ